MRNRSTWLGVLCLAAACSQGTQEIARSAAPPAGSGGNTSAGMSTGTGGAGTIGSGAGSGGHMVPIMSEDDAGMSFGPSCATAQYGAELDTLDMLILLDQ